MMDAATEIGKVTIRHLQRPPIWDKLTPAQRMGMINGCGGAGSFLSHFVPNHIGFVDVYPACAIHDVCYATGYPKQKADLMLLCNLILLCCVGPKYLWALRCFQCVIFYLAVAIFGDRFYTKKTGKKRARTKRKV